MKVRCRKRSNPPRADKLRSRNEVSLSAARLGGFTLLEILVAVAIFAVLAAMAYGGLNSIVRAQIAVRESSDALVALSRALTRFEKDLAQAYSRSARGAYGTTEPAMVGDSNSLIVTTMTIAASAAGPSASPVRVRHSLAQSRWLRAQTAALDLAPSTPETARLVLDDFSDASLRYLDAQLIEHDRWPPANAALEGRSPDALPRAVELRFTSKRFGEIRRLFALTEVRQ